MARRCFPYTGSLGIPREIVTLDRQVSHHVANVVRLKKGDLLELKDGRGGWCIARVEDTASTGMCVRIVEFLHGGAESTLHLSLCMAFARPERMDIVVRQATELGATQLFGFKAQRSQYGLSRVQMEKRRERWEKIALEAVCQCRRVVAPRVCLCRDARTLVEELTEPEGGAVLKILADESEPFPGDGDSPFGSRMPFRTRPDVVMAIIGPEGGWASEEVEFFQSKGFASLRMGPRILRYETAATAILSVAQFIWGDMGTGFVQG